MNGTTLIGLAALVAALICGGCSRLVTIEPELVSSRNDADWTIRSVPTAVPPPAAKTAPAPAAGDTSPAAPAGP